MARAISYAARSGVVVAAQEPPDSYGEKLVKYVPAEVLAFFLSAVTVAGGRRSYLIISLVVGAIGTVIYLWVRKTATTRWFFYVLALLAFVSWAVGTSAPVAALVGVAAEVGTFWLMVAVFLIPLIDEALTKAGW